MLTLSSIEDVFKTHCVRPNCWGCPKEKIPCLSLYYVSTGIYLVHANGSTINTGCCMHLWAKWRVFSCLCAFLCVLCLVSSQIWPAEKPKCAQRCAKCARNASWNTPVSVSPFCVSLVSDHPQIDPQKVRFLASFTRMAKYTTSSILKLETRP